MFYSTFLLCDLNSSYGCSENKQEEVVKLGVQEESVHTWMFSSQGQSCQGPCPTLTCNTGRGAMLQRRW